MKALSVLFLLACIGFSPVYGQTDNHKIGYIDQQHVFENLPEFKKLNMEIVEKSEQYDKILKSKYEELKVKSEAFEKLAATQTTSEAILRDKATELDNLKKSYDDFQTNAMAELKNYYGKKFTPIKQKVNEAIIFAGRQKDYAFILRMDLNPDGGDIWPVVLYARDSTSNLTSEILKNLGVNNASASTRKVGLPQVIKEKK